MWMAEAKAAKKIPLGNKIIKKNAKITITEGTGGYKYTLWDENLYALSGEYVKDIKVCSIK
jgi:hypothetical protein